MAGTHLFIVHIRREGPAFSASARRIDEELAGHFDQPLTLLEFLVGPVPPAPPGQTQGDADDPVAPS